MIHRILSAALISAVAATPALAQQFNGGSVSGQYKQYTDDGADLETLSIELGVEWAIVSNFALGGNASFYQETESSEDGVANSTLHFMFGVSPNTAAGAFAALDTSDATNSFNYGIEFGSRSENGRFEAYYGWADPDEPADQDITIAGLAFDVNLGNGFTIGLEYESNTVDDSLPTVTGLADLTLSDTALVAQYRFGNGPSIYAEVGRITASSSDDDVDAQLSGEAEYIGIGARYTLGRPGGNIFGDRTLIGFGG